MYHKPLRFDANDPLCAATSLEGTVIGILFEKSGAQVVEAISKRLQAINDDIEKHAGLIGPIQEFLKEKELLISEVQEAERERNNLRSNFLRPIVDKLDKLEIELASEGHGFDEQTRKTLRLLGKKFDSGWDDVEPQLEEIAAHLVERQYELDVTLSQTPTTGTSSSSSSEGYSVSANSAKHMSTSHSDGTIISWQLKRKLSDSKDAFLMIKDRIEELQLERRRLEMISRNISPDRSFKLNLTQLCAFGFEDIVLE